MTTLGPRGRAAIAAIATLGLLGAPVPSASADPARVWHLASGGEDSGDCSSAAPCARLDYVGDLLQPGDTVQLGAGVYPVGDATFNINSVTYENSGSGEAKITVPADSYGIQVTASYVTFRNLTVSSPDDTVQGDTWGFTYSGGATGLTLDQMRVGHVATGVMGILGSGVTVTDSTFTDIVGSSIDVDHGLSSVTDSEFTSGTGIHVKPQATVLATGNVFRGNTAGDGGLGISVDGREGASGIATGNRFTTALEFGVLDGSTLEAANNWWGCNEGADQPGCVVNYDLPVENAEPHLVLTLTATPNPFLTTGFSTLTTSLASSDPESTYVGGPIGTQVALATSAGALDDSIVTLDAGSAQTALRNTTPGSSTVTAILDDVSVDLTVVAAAPVTAQAITFTSTAPTGAVVGGSYPVTATGGASGNAVTFSIDGTSTFGACTVGGSTVTFTGVGQCVVDADQLGDSDHAAAAQQQQAFAIAAAPVPPAASASLSPSSFAYDTVAAGAGAPPQTTTFTLTNTGNRDLTVQAPTLTGVDRADYALGAISCAATLVPAGQCTYAVTFAPVALDTTYASAASLNVPFSPVGDPAAATATSALSGRVTEMHFDLEADSAAVDFGSATVSTTTAPRTITFTNHGQRVVRPAAARLIGAAGASYAIVADGCQGAQVAPAGTCAVAVAFAPTGLGVAPATLSLGYDGAAVVDVALSGVGVAEPLELGPVLGSVGCLTYGAPTPKKNLALRASSEATISWEITKVRGSKGLAQCPGAGGDARTAVPSRATSRAGAVTTTASGFARIALTTLLPPAVRRQMEPGRYRVAFVAWCATASSQTRVIFIRVLKRR